MHDSIELERLGRPVALVVTEPFIGTARAAAAIAGIPDYSFIVIPHPLSRLDRAEIRSRAEAAVDDVLQRLLHT